MILQVAGPAQAEQVAAVTTALEPVELRVMDPDRALLALVRRPAEAGMVVS
jgi:hypothetical protein